MQVSVRASEVVNGIRAGILELMWDANKLVFYDFNPTPNSRNSIFSTATFYPPKSSPRNPIQGTYNGTFPTTFVGWTRQEQRHTHLVVNLLRGCPNAWPQVAAPLIHYIIFSTERDPSVQSQNKRSPHAWIWPVWLYSAPAFTPTLTFCPDIPKRDGNRTWRRQQSSTGQSLTAGTHGWAATLGRGLANRYLTGALCSWHATGGSIPNLLPAP